MSKLKISVSQNSYNQNRNGELWDSIQQACRA